MIKSKLYKRKEKLAAGVLSVNLLLRTDFTELMDNAHRPGRGSGEEVSSLPTGIVLGSRTLPFTPHPSLLPLLERAASFHHFKVTASLELPLHFVLKITG